MMKVIRFCFFITVKSKMKKCILFFSLLLNVVLILFFFNMRIYSDRLQREIESSEKEIFQILEREQKGFNAVEGFEQGLGKVVLVLPEGICMGCSEHLFDQINQLTDIQKENLLLVIPLSTRRQFEIYNNSMYKLKHVIYSSGFLNFSFTEPFLFYMSREGQMHLPVCLNGKGERLEQFFYSILK